MMTDAFCDWAGPCRDPDCQAWRSEQRTPPADRQRTIAHLSSTCLNEAGHVTRHLIALRHAIDRGDWPSAEHNLTHAENHTAEGLEHARKLRDELGEFDPAIAAETDALAAVTRGFAGDDESWHRSMRAWR